jgi:hypothetical protein
MLLLLLLIIRRAHNSTTDKQNVFGDEFKANFSYFVGFCPLYLLVLLLLFYFCEKLTTKKQILRTRQICRICSKFRIVVIMFMIYVHARFHTPSYNGLSVIAIKSNVKDLSLTTSTYLLYILQK